MAYVASHIACSGRRLTPFQAVCRVALVGAVAAVVLVAVNLSSADDLTIAAAFGMEEQVGLEQLIEPPVEAILE